MPKPTPKLTADQFKKAVKALKESDPDFDSFRIELAEEVLTGEYTSKMIAEMYEVSYMIVNRTVNKILDYHFDTASLPKGWVCEAVELPKDEMARVKELSRQLKKAHRAEKRKAATK
jgi:transposase-like protein